ncbi:MAG TPA: thioredoxin domain-containing protein [Candidatus Saccharimonadales bacterium]|nr:thioredoxin domain-containing protein [Candidatus Saccharimonadales bacterium]
MSKKTWIIFAAVCVVVLAGLIYFSSRNRVDVSGIDSSKILAATSQSGNIADHVFGKADSKVIFVEYGDYQCPGCGNAYAPVKEITEKYKDKVAFVFRNFPLSSLHPNARAAAATAEAAGLQGKYWEMHDKLYETQNSWNSLDGAQRSTYFEDAAKELGLNIDTFKKDVNAGNVLDKINFDLALGKSIGITSTPSFYLNGQKFDPYTNNQFDSDKVSKAFEDKLK